MPLTTYTAGEVLTAASLNANFTFAALGGKLGQVVSTGKADAFSSTTGSFIDITGLSVSITPTVATSKVLVMVTLQASSSGSGDTLFKLLRGATDIAISTAGSSINGFSQINTAESATMLSNCITYLDSPATTSATTYKVQMRTSVTGYVNRRGFGADYGGFSTITVMEILA